MVASPGSRPSLLAYLFLAPAGILFSVFVIYPFLVSVWWSLTDWDGLSEVPSFIGFQNYVEIAQDPLFWKSIGNNAIWTLVVPTVTIVLGLLLAVLLWSRPPGYSLLRTTYFVPQVLGPAIVGVIWLVMYQPRRGALHEIGEATGLAFLTQGFLADPGTALAAIMVAEIWYGIGFFVVIFLAGLQSVDTELLDASRLDGAGYFEQLRQVIIPQLAPVLTIACVLALIGSLNVFDIIFAMTGGGPANSTEVLGTYTYTKAFQQTQIGYGSALTVIMAALALGLSALLLYTRRSRAS